MATRRCDRGCGKIFEIKPGEPSQSAFCPECRKKEAPYLTKLWGDRPDPTRFSKRSDNGHQRASEQAETTPGGHAH